MRDVLAHVYFGVSEDRIWDIVTVHVPALAEFVRKTLNDEDADKPPAPQ